ncbi:MAG: DoxX family protein [Parvibaculaceae bacterium]
MNDTLILLGRILLSVLFLVAGVGKLMDANAFAGALGGMGFPAPLAMAYLVGAFELLGGLAVLLGFQTRPAAILLALFCVATGLIAHLTEFSAFMKNLGLAGGFLALAASGAGAFSLDARRRTTVSA